ncbi:MAG: hypothetical protein IJ773_03405 [Lachnospiraceae bacterium]|nr:hypothetical protein [Lachnospiraceae bacterium]
MKNDQITHATQMKRIRGLGVLKRATAVLLALSLLSLCGCGKGSSSLTEDPAQESGTNAQTESVPEPTLPVTDIESAPAHTIAFGLTDILRDDEEKTVQQPGPATQEEPEPVPHSEPAPEEEPEPYAEPEPKDEPEPYVEPEPYEEPEPYVEPEPYEEPEPYVEPEPYEEPETEGELEIELEPYEGPEQSDAARLECSNWTNSLIIVEAYGTLCTVSMHERDENGVWTEIFRTDGWVGEGEVGPTDDYNHATPPGVFTLGQCFGTLPDPGCTRDYLQLDDSWYWVDDPESVHYNQLISTNWEGYDTSQFNSAEHLIDYDVSYQYSVAINYNTDPIVKGMGSAIFFHVEHASPTWGCIGVPIDIMVTVLQRLTPYTLIAMGNSEGPYCVWDY